MQMASLRSIVSPHPLPELKYPPISNGWLFAISHG
jgi:hypothetical protein